MPFKIKLLLVYLFLCVILCCNPAKQSETMRTAFRIESEEAIDQFLVLDANTGDTLHFSFSPLPSDTFAVEVTRPTLAQVVVNDQGLNEFMISPYTSRVITLTATDSSLTSNDTLNNTLQGLSNQDFAFVQQNMGKILNATRKRDVAGIFDSIRLSGLQTIDSLSTHFSEAELDFLRDQYRWRGNSFRYWNGRNNFALGRDDEYFQFARNQAPDTAFLGAAPIAELYRLEIEYVTERGSIEGIDSFISYIRSQHAANPDLADYLVAIYIKEVIVSPDYWTLHQPFLNRQVVERMHETEQDNPYRRIFLRPVLTQMDVLNQPEAFDFYALNPQADTVRLSSFAGSYVLLDFWATWCGPCIQQEPHFQELVRSFAAGQPIRFVKVSTDAMRRTWLSYIKQKADKGIVNLWVNGDQHHLLKAAYSLHGLPRYVLVGPDGKIIDDNVSAPSLQVAEDLRRMLRENS